eukprot:TRINITY_DN47861_c0_g1_i1.p1 TRINITY_DN47861_c0_g1~~TRINITY_DN47861_c0_g1_i1.p1  ORF type:complete len:633 (-),score=106.97 TRINITY_DN47861_c0_g1_i1:16-1878(-)
MEDDQALDDDKEAQEEELKFCVVCYEGASGAKLHPCGHDFFCFDCARRFRTCPLCRVPLTTENGEAWIPSGSQASQTPPRQRLVMSDAESRCVVMLCFAVWLFIFIGGIMEYFYGVPGSCLLADPLLGSSDAGEGVVGLREADVANFSCSSNLLQHEHPVDQYCVCKECSSKGCLTCADGFVNHGAQCFKYFENFPSQQVGAALGGSTYFVLIVTTQVLGVCVEICLIQRLRRRQLMPRKELIVLVLALIIEITRMFMVDLFMLQEYFGGRSYSIFREPLSCAEGVGWLGADAQWYCDDKSQHSLSTRYYVASFREAFSQNSLSSCTLFDTSSALLDFKVTAPKWPSPGSPRFENLGWIVGGEFALYYFFATFINELADCMFVVPTTTNMGMMCKIFSVALEVFQLGALCPAAIFTHGDCLRYHDPLGVSLHLISFIVCAFGYGVWGFLFLSLPLAGLGFFALVFLALLSCGLWATARIASFRGASATSEALDKASEHISLKLQRFVVWARSSGEGCASAIATLAFVPLLLGGFFLGALVVIGQASKEHVMEVLTALVLLSDVLLKVGATAVTEIAEYALHRRVRRAVEQRAEAPPRSAGTVVGHSALDEPADPSPVAAD